VEQGLAKEMTDPTSIIREVLLLRRIEVAGSSSHEMEDRVKMRIGDTEATHG